ncbi:MAG: helix-turn-helix domain-containing protein [Armatimonadota bacterium]
MEKKCALGCGAERGDAMSRFQVRDQRDPGWSWFDNELLSYVKCLGSDGKPLGVNGGMIYMVLARYAGTRGRCQLSITKIADILVLSRPTVIKYLAKLEELGLIAKVSHMVEGSDEQACNEYILLKIKGENGGSKTALLPGKSDLLDCKSEFQRSQADLLPGQNTLSPGQLASLPGQPGEPPRQASLPHVGKEVDQGSQPAFPIKEEPKIIQEEESIKTQEYSTGTKYETMRPSAAAPLPPVADIPVPEKENTPGGVEAALTLLTDTDGTMLYPHLAEVYGWYRERFNADLLARPVGNEQLRIAEEALAQLSATVARRGKTLLHLLDVRCYYNLKKNTLLRRSSAPFADFTAQVAYALEDLGVTAPPPPPASSLPAGETGASPLTRPWYSATMSEEERYWRELSAKDEHAPREEGETHGR